MGSVWKAQGCNDAGSSTPGVMVSSKTTKTEHLLSHQSKPKDKQLESSHFRWQPLYDSKASASENTLTSPQMTCRQRFRSSIAKQHMKSHFCLSQRDPDNLLAIYFIVNKQNTINLHCTKRKTAYYLCTTHSIFLRTTMVFMLSYKTLLKLTGSQWLLAMIQGRIPP